MKLYLVNIVLFWFAIFERAECTNNLEECSLLTPDDRKFDCLPRGTPTPEECSLRNCCWTTEKQDEKAPLCYYPTGYKSYDVIEREKFPQGEILLLNLTNPSVYPNNIRSLRVEITYETKSQVHVKITDAQKHRYEPPYPRIPSFKRSSNKWDYNVLIHERPFGFAIVQESTGNAIFDTRNIGGFTFSDQFLQISAIIPSKFIYGLAESRNNFLLNVNWNTITLFNHDSAPKDNVNLYGSHPFYLSIDKSGKSHGVFLLNSNAMDIVLQPAPAITYRAIGGVFDFYFFLGPKPADVVKQYTQVIGKSFFPPYWSLGFQLCRWGWESLNRTKEVWKRNWDSGIPFDVLWNDIDYMDKHNDFTVGPSFAGLSKFVEEIHDVGMKYVVILDPGIASREPPGTHIPYEEGLLSNVFIKNASGLPLEGVVWNDNQGTVFPDFTHPNASKYWTKMISELYKDIKFDGLWVDMNEISNFVDGSIEGCNTDNNLNNPPYVPHVQNDSLNFRTICMSGKENLGFHYNLHNLYGFLESMVTVAALRNTIHEKRTFVLSRSTFSGSGHFVAHWTGDIFSTWDDMKHTIGDIMTFNILGIPMVGADICGFNYNTTKELCQRWSQLGAFYPFSRNHNGINYIDQDPAAMHIVEPTKKALRFRYHLLPYLYTLFWNAHKYGETVIRPLFFEFPEDVYTFAENTQFMWGHALLVIPILNEAQISVKSYFPKGSWFDAYTYKKIESKGENITIDAPLDTIPLFFKAGNIIPYQEPAQTTSQSRKNPFGLYVTIGSTDQAHGTLHWDDGESDDKLDNYESNLLRFEYCNSTIVGVPSAWSYNVSMLLNTIKVMGLSDSGVHQVFLNGQHYNNFKFNADNQYMVIEDLGIDLSKSFSIHWNPQKKTSEN